MFVSRVGAFLAVLVLLAGCAGGSSPDEAGMRAWVDERGQVRYTPVPGKRTEEDKSSGAEGQAGSQDEASSPADPVYNLENFPPADEATEQDEELYYTWRDAEGRVHNTPYSLSEEKIARVSRPDSGPTVSSARVTTKGDEAVAGYNPSEEAKRILGLDAAPGRLDAFADNCCSGLPRLETYQLTPERGVGIQLEEDSAVHRFSTGASRFALIQLSGKTEDALVRVRSFVRDGAFMPNLAFLNADFEPVRLVTDITFDFTPETWSRYAYLEAFIPLDQQPSEQWAVVFTRERDLAGTTRITNEAGRTTVVKHSPTGSLEITIP